MTLSPDCPLGRAFEETVRANPGIELHAIQRRLEIPWSTVLQMLHAHVAAFRVETKGLGKMVRIFPLDEKTRAAKVRALLTGRAAKTLARSIITNPGLTPSEILEREGLNTRALRPLLRMKAAQLVLEVEGKLTPSQQLIDLMRTEPEGTSP